MALSIGRYRIVERIAAGGMGEVYRASAEAVDGVAKEVALKVLLPELATREDFAALFVEEMKVALTLSHANVVQTFDVGRIDDRYFLAMELVDGTTLAGLLDAREDGVELAWSDRHAVTIAVEALKGLDYAHRRRGPDGRPLGLVHRDVSPSNVLVSAEGEVKVADFGIATSALRSWRSMAGTLAGKVEYMAPEQLRGEPLDRRADVWAMGVVLFEMLAGRRPFVGSYPDVVPEVVEGRRPRLRDLRDDVPERLAQVVERALEVDRERRFPNAAAMRQELEELAMALGWMLAVTDLAELVQQTRDADPEDASRRAASTGWLAVTGGSASAPVRTADGEAAISTTTASGDASRGVSSTDAFDVILGRQLDRLSDDDGFSVYRTAPRLSASGAPSVTPPRGGAPLRLAVEKLPPPPRMPDVTSTQHPRSPWLALGAGVLAVLV
ncbi:MAG: serine/threonine protein kinase, partial [Deltaproteobacteria bacterium]|nr:serine/threonine protein kinase [Deltaproteobacteria bacterium]